MTNSTHINTRAEAPDGRARYSSSGGPLVLVAEDHEDTRFLLRALLEMRGYRVVEAEDGEDAIRRAEVIAPDLILMDGSMPRVDGLTATRRIRERAQLRRVPVIILSGHAHPADRETALAAGCDDYLTKPLDADQFYLAVEKQIARRRPLRLVKADARHFERVMT